MIVAGDEAFVAPGERGEAEVEDAVQFVKGDAHVEASFGGGESVASGLLHDGKRVEIEPTDGAGIDGVDGCVFGGFEAGAQGRDAVFDEIETGALHDVVFVVVGGGNDFFGDTEGGTDFGAGEFSVFGELQISGGEFGGSDVGGAPEEERAVGSAGVAAAVAESGADLFALIIGELLFGADDEAGIGVVVHEAVHKMRGGEIGSGGEHGDLQRGEAAPGVEGIGEIIEPDFFGEEDLGFERAVHGTDVTPAYELMVVDDVLEMCGID